MVCALKHVCVCVHEDVCATLLNAIVLIKQRCKVMLLSWDIRLLNDLPNMGFKCKDA